MALSVNKVTLLGNVGKDPDYRVTPNGTPVCKFTIATSESFKNSSDQWEEKTEWHNVECWRYIADTANKHLRKGTKVYIEGKLKTDSYEKDGITRYITKIVATELVLIQKSDNQTPPQASDYRTPVPPDRRGLTSYDATPPMEYGNDDDMTDIPF